MRNCAKQRQTSRHWQGEEKGERKRNREEWLRTARNWDINTGPLPRRLLNSFARTTCSLTRELEGKWMIRCLKTTCFCPTVSRIGQPKDRLSLDWSLEKKPWDSNITLTLDEKCKFCQGVTHVKTASNTGKMKNKKSGRKAKQDLGKETQKGKSNRAVSKFEEAAQHGLTLC